MSEYQYYEFRAIDRALTDRQMRELRAMSTRAAISRTSFSNYYTFGDLKANPRDLLVKYFDASLYFANWLFLEVAFRYPKGVVDVRALRRYAVGHTLEVRSTARDVIVSISVESDRDSFDAADDGSSWLASLIGLRADLASGDERVLYLAWLLDLQCGEIDANALEPARPEGLGKLTPALDSFIDIGPECRLTSELRISLARVTSGTDMLDGRWATNGGRTPRRYPQPAQPCGPFLGHCTLATLGEMTRATGTRTYSFSPGVTALAPWRALAAVVTALTGSL
jgi:hypothetical protein